MDGSERLAVGVVVALGLVTLLAHLSPDPHNVPQRRAMALRAQQEGDWQRAVSLLLENALVAREYGPTRIDNLADASRVAMNAQQLELAEAFYLEALQIDPEQPPLTLRRHGIELYLALGDHERAIAQTRALMALPQGHGDLALLELVVNASASGVHAAEALALLDEQLRAQPTHERLALQTCRTLEATPFPDDLQPSLLALALRIREAHPEMACTVREIAP